MSGWRRRGAGCWRRSRLPGGTAPCPSRTSSAGCGSPRPVLAVPVPTISPPPAPAGCARLSGPGGALAALVARHEILRTVFGEAEGRPFQRVLPPAAVPLPVREVGPDGLSAAIEAEAAVAFDLEQGPLLRAVLLRLAPADHALLLLQHHLVSDGWLIDLWCVSWQHSMPAGRRPCRRRGCTMATSRPGRHRPSTRR
ncbi:MAG: condensation domain-containing protein [Geminicoccaceae bacterium]